MKNLVLLFRPITVAFCVSLPFATAYSAVPPIVTHGACKETCDGAGGIPACTTRTFPECGTQAVCKGTGESLCEDCTCGSHTLGNECLCEK